jgi:catechol 2,3-dioxygenase-like lactoylglutathione lyase family enzyme
MGCAGTDEKKDQIPLDAADFVRDVEIPCDGCVSDVEASCRFFVARLGFTVRFKYGKPVFYALVQRDSACLILRYVHGVVLHREADRDLLSASIPVGNVKAVYLEYQSLGVPMHQRLKKQPWGIEDFIVRDLDKNLIHFAESIGSHDV